MQQKTKGTSKKGFFFLFAPSLPDTAKKKTLQYGITVYIDSTLPARRFFTTQMWLVVMYVNM